MYEHNVSRVKSYAEIVVGSKHIYRIIFSTYQHVVYVDGMRNDDTCIHKCKF